jgi:integron integrase
MAERKLLDQVSDVARFRHLSRRTEETYRNWIKRYIIFHNKTHPRDLDRDAVRMFLTHLAVDEHVAASTQNQAFNALLFLYRQVLHIELQDIQGVIRPRPSRNLPVVFTKTESNDILMAMSGSTRLIAALLYGSGLRIMEAVRLRVKDLDFARNEIHVRDGKGERDRVTMLPRSLHQPLRKQIERVSQVHFSDLKRGYGEVYLPYALDRKYSNASRALPWQYLFPADKLSLDPRSGKVRRHHVNEQNVQRAVKSACEWQASEKMDRAIRFGIRLPLTCLRMDTT